MRLRALAARAVSDGLAQGFVPDELEAALGLELAAWRERRQARPVPVRQDGRLARFAGSHDLALEALWAQARRRQPPLALEPRYVGSLDGLLALLHGEAGLAGSHLLDEESGEYNVPVLRRLFIGVPLCLVTLAEREQGLILARGNPLRVGGYPDLARPQVRYVNRQPGSGTRSLLDHSLRRQAVNPAEIRGTTAWSPRTWRWPRRWPRAARTPGWASGRPPGPSTWTSCPWRGSATTWCSWPPTATPRPSPSCWPCWPGRSSAPW